MAKTYFVLFTSLGLALLLLGSCNPFDDGRAGSQVGTNYHPGTVSDVPPFGVLGGTKISPGSSPMRSTNLALTATVTPTNSLAVGSTISGRFSIQHSR